MKPITTKQFVGWLIITGIGVAMWILLPESLFGLVGVVIGFSGFILMSPAELHQPLGLKQSVQALGFLLVSVLVFFALRRWVGDDGGREVLRFMRQPGFILPVWIVGIWLTYRRWQFGKQTAQPIIGANVG